LRHVNPTRAPRLANRRTHAAPIPRDPPVTSTHRFSNSIIALHLAGIAESSVVARVVNAARPALTPCVSAA
jgi:hypothetical protein